MSPSTDRRPGPVDVEFPPALGGGRRMAAARAHAHACQRGDGGTGVGIRRVDQPTLAAGHDLHRIERPGGELAEGAGRASAPAGGRGAGGILDQRDSVGAAPRDDRIHVAGNAAEMQQHQRPAAGGAHALEILDPDVEGPGTAVAEDHSRARMGGCLHRADEGNRRRDDLVAVAQPQRFGDVEEAVGGRIDRQHLVGGNAEMRRELALEQPRLRSAPEPRRFDHAGQRGEFLRPHVGMEQPNLRAADDGVSVMGKRWRGRRRSGKANGARRPHHGSTQ